MNQIIESLFARKSVRAFTEQEIPEEIVQVILQASTQAPTAGNQQLYTILRITDPCYGRLCGIGNRIWNSLAQRRVRGTVGSGYESSDLCDGKVPEGAVLQFWLTTTQTPL